MGAKKCHTDPCLYAYYKDKNGVINFQELKNQKDILKNVILIGVLGVHVDDVRCTGDKLFEKEVKPKLQSLYEWGEWECMKYKYTGVLHDGSQGEYLTYSMEGFLKTLEPVDLKNATNLLNPEKDKPRDEWTLNAKGMTVFRGICGSCQWATTQGRPDFAGNVGPIQAALAKPTYADLKKAAEVVRNLTEDKERNVTMKPIPLQGMNLIGLGDASFGKRPMESQVVVSTTEEFLKSEEVDVSLMDWKNHKIATATGSTLTSETAAIKNLFGMLEWMRNTFLDVLHASWCPRNADDFDDTYGIKITGITDCASLYDHLTKECHMPKDERVRIPCLVIKSDLQKPNTAIRWSPTTCQLGDVGTKPESPMIPQLQAVMSGRWQWIAPEEPGENKIAEEAELYTFETGEVFVSEAYRVRPFWIFMFIQNLLVSDAKPRIRKQQTLKQKNNQDVSDDDLTGLIIPNSVLAIMDDVTWQNVFDNIRLEFKEASFFSFYKGLMYCIMIEIPMLFLHILWRTLENWRYYHENLLCGMQTISMMMAFVAIFYRKFWRRVEVSERYDLKPTENDLTDTQTQTDLTFRQSWDPKEKRWSRGRFYYGFHACTTVLRYLLWRPFAVLKNPMALQRTILDEFPAAHPTEKHGTWKTMQKAWNDLVQRGANNSGSLLPTAVFDNRDPDEKAFDCTCTRYTAYFLPEQPSGWHCFECVKAAASDARREAKKQSDDFYAASILELQTQVREKEEQRMRLARVAADISAQMVMNPGAAAPVPQAPVQQQQALQPQPSAPVVPETSPASDQYPYNLDGRKIIFGKHRGRKYWELTGIDTAYCAHILATIGGCQAERTYRDYLLARGFPGVKAPRIYN